MTAPILINLTNITKTALDAYKDNYTVMASQSCGYDLQRTIQSMNDSLVVMPYIAFYLLIALHIILLAYLFTKTERVRTDLVKLALMTTIAIYCLFIPFIFRQGTTEFNLAVWIYAGVIFTAILVNAVLEFARRKKYI